MIKLIWAMDPKRTIGKNNNLPWKIKEELKHFSNVTRNNYILMGRKTFESLPKILPNRIHIVVTKNKNLKSNNPTVIYCSNLKEVIEKYKKEKKDLYIVGGAEIYKQSLPFADELIITEIKEIYEGDTVFPDFDINNFKLIKNENYVKFIVKYYKRKA